MLVLGVSAVGLAWLVLLVALGALALSTKDLIPMVGIFPLPTLLFGGGILAGWLISLLCRVPAALAARRRAGRARKRMRAAVEEVAIDDVVDGIETILAERAQLAGLVAQASGSEPAVRR
jgi:hypothetical protein